MGKALVFGLMPDQIIDYQDQLKALIEKPLKKFNGKCYTPEHVIEKCLNFEWQCWVACSEKEKIDCVFITFITVYPTGHKIFNIPYVGGSNIGKWFNQGWAVLKSYAKANNCNEIQGGRREGWMRMLSEENFEKRLIFSVEI
jgi:hypothetical protein